MHSSGAKLSADLWMRNKCQGNQLAFEIGPATPLTWVKIRKD